MRDWQLFAEDGGPAEALHVRFGHMLGVICGAVVLCLAIGSAAVAEQANVYAVANYPVEAQAKDAVTAKKKAHAEGQQAAFRSLLKRIVPVTAYQRIKALAGVDASQYVEGVSVLSEKNSSTEYYANLDFVFSKQAVQALLQQQSVPFIDTPAKKIVLVPAYRKSAKSELQRALGEWGEIWQGLDLANSVTPAIVRPLKREVHRDTIASVAAGGGDGLRILAGEYGSQQVVVMVAELDQPAKKLHVTLAGRDAVGPIAWKRSYRIYDGDVAYAMEFAAVVGLGVLEGRWKAVMARSRGGVDVLAGPGETVDILVQFSSLAEWYQMRRKIQQLQGARDFQEGGVSAASAQIRMKFPGGGQQLAVVVARHGMRLSEDGSGGWLLRSSF